MPTTQTLDQLELNTEVQPVINDFSITVGTVNGSGSQTSNLTILRALFKMGIPVSGKNLFPSNIQGLPTWYTIRVSKDGYLARREEHEIVVAMNPATFAQDLADVAPGGVFFYADDIKLAINRDGYRGLPDAGQETCPESSAPRPACATTLPTWSTSASWPRCWASTWSHLPGAQFPLQGQKQAD